MPRFSRLMWKARKRRRHPGTLDRIAVKGTVLHWPGMAKPVRGVKNVAAYLRGIQNYHMDDRGWSDIAYNIAVDQDGNEYRLRGMKYRSAANGSTGLNLSYVAVLLILAPDEVPTPAMVRTTRKVLARVRKTYPNGRAVVGHGSVRPGGTSCPGPVVNNFITSGEFR